VTRQPPGRRRRARRQVYIVMGLLVLLIMSYGVAGRLGL